MLTPRKVLRSLFVLFCNKNHIPDRCFSAQNMSLDQRMQVIKDKKACLRCLKEGHFAARCKSKLKCPVCRKAHVIIMCPTLDNKNEHKLKNFSSESATPNLFSGSINKGQVCFQTLKVLK